jgi:hypothetical protein
VQVGGVLFPLNEFFYASGLTFVDYVLGAPFSSCIPFGCTCGWIGIDGSPVKVPYTSDFMYANGYTQRVEKLQFINSPHRAFWERTDIMIDLDGTLSGKPMQYVTAYSKFNAWPECTVSDTLGAGILSTPYPHYGAGMYCKPYQAIRRVYIEGITPGQPASAGIWVTGGAPGQRAGQWNAKGDNFIMTNASRTGVVGYVTRRSTLQEEPPHNHPSFPHVSAVLPPGPVRDPATRTTCLRFS